MRKIILKKYIRRAQALILAVFLAVSGAVSPAASARAYAASAGAALTAWEVLQLLLMSAGVTVQTARSASGGTEISDEEYYRAFMAAQADEAWCEAVDSTIRSALAKGTSSAALTVEFAQETWNELRDWVSGMAQSGSVFSYGSDDFVNPVNISGIEELENLLGITFASYASTQSAVRSMLSWDNLSVYSCRRDSSGSWLLMVSAASTVSLSLVDDVLYADSSDGDLRFCYFYLYSSVWQSYSSLVGKTGVYSAVSFVTPSRYSDFVPILINSNAASESLGLISDVFYAELKDRVYDVVTPHRVLTDEGAITGNMTLTIPKSLAVSDAIAAVKEGTLPITDALAKVGVIPVDMTKKKAIADDKTIDEALEAVESTSDSWSFTADLTEIFPFCLPFDLIRFLDALDADPVAPCFEIPFVVEALGIDMSVEFDMSFMDDAVEIFRIGELGCFIISLILVTQKLIKW